MTEKKFFINDAKAFVPNKNDSPYKRVLAVGDVHASFDKLLSLWQKISVTDDDLVIFLGDYLYGLGNKNIETLRWLIEHNKKKNIIFLRGNVDETYLHSLFDKQGQLLSNCNKGIAREIKRAALNEPNLPNEIFDFLNNLPLSYQIMIGGRKFFFCHAGIKVGTPFNKQTKTYLLDHPELKNFYRDYSGEAVVVVGHKSPKKISAKLPQLFAADLKKLDLTKPLKVPDKNILMLDTRAKEDGQLSCVDVLSGEFWQSETDTDSAAVDSILFVCSGNTCRSPMAKYVMRYLLNQRGLYDKVRIDSAGCNTRGGGPMSKPAQAVLNEEHIPFDRHISKMFTPKEYNKFKCIIALDENMLRRAKEISGGDPDKKIRLFTNLYGRRLNVDDPLHTGNYRKAYEDIHLGCLSLLKEIFG